MLKTNHALTSKSLHPAAYRERESVCVFAVGNFLS